MKQILLNIYFQFFGFLAKHYIKKYNPFVIGITGSIGKTSCRMIISEVLEKNLKDKIVYTSSKNFNGELGMSLSILGISDYEPKIINVLKTIKNALKISFFGEKLYDIIVLEYGIDHIGEMDFLLSIVKPDIGIVTKIDKVHSSQFESKDIIALEKYKLLKSSKEISFLNYDDEYASIYEKEINSNKYFYTTNNKLTSENIDLKGINYTLKYENNTIKSNFDFFSKNTKKIQGELFGKNKREYSGLNITSNLVGEENIGYICVGFNILDYLFEKYYNKSYFVVGVEKITINFTLQYSRFSIFNGINNSILIDSSYNAAPESMKKVINNFMLINKNIFPDYKTILCLGEMRELGEFEKIEHEKLANFIEDKTENIFIVGNSMKEYFLPVSKKAIHFKNSKLLGEYLKDFILNSNEKYIILFKGSQNTIFMEEALKQVLKNKSDTKKICRQEDYWLEKKNNFFDK